MSPYKNVSNGAKIKNMTEQALKIKTGNKLISVACGVLSKAKFKIRIRIDVGRAFFDCAIADKQT